MGPRQAGKQLRVAVLGDAEEISPRSDDLKRHDRFLDEPEEMTVRLHSEPHAEAAHRQVLHLHLNGQLIPQRDQRARHIPHVHQGLAHCVVVELGTGDSIQTLIDTLPVKRRPHNTKHTDRALLGVDLDNVPQEALDLGAVLYEIVMGGVSGNLA